MCLQVKAITNTFYLCFAYRKPSKADFCKVLQSNIDTVNEIQGAKILLSEDLNADLFTP